MALTAQSSNVHLSPLSFDAILRKLETTPVNCCSLSCIEAQLILTRLEGNDFQLGAITIKNEWGPQVEKCVFQ